MCVCVCALNLSSVFCFDFAVCYLFPNSDLHIGIYLFCAELSIHTLGITEAFLGTFIGAEEGNGPPRVSSLIVRQLCLHPKFIFVKLKVIEFWSFSQLRC